MMSIGKYWISDFIVLVQHAVYSIKKYGFKKGLYIEQSSTNINSESKF